MHEGRKPMSSRRTFLEVTGAALLFGVHARSVSAGSPEVNVGYFNKLAVGGYDPVAYFKMSRPVEGDRDIFTDYRGARWVFASEEHRRMFRQDPEMYAPKYGGYCAYAAAQGQVSDIDPHAWQIHEGRLYLNYSPRVQRLWGNDIAENIRKADAIWPSPLNQ